MHIFDLLAGTTLHLLKDMSELELLGDGYDETDFCIRDVSWHPERSIIAHTSFLCEIKVWDYESDDIKIREIKDF